jgi:hypothetical protein
MFNTEKKSILGYNEYSREVFKESIPLFLPDNQGPWAVRYAWIKNDDTEFLKNYHSENTGERHNVRKSSSHLEKFWIPHNCLMINQGHLGNIVWRIKIGNPFNNSIDIIEVWRSRKIIDDLFSFKTNDFVEIEQAEKVNPFVYPALTDINLGGTGLRNGSGLTIDDVDAPKFIKKQDIDSLMTGLLDLGFDIRVWKDYPLISKKQSIEIYNDLKERSKHNSKIKINTGWNSEINPL